MPKFLNNFDFHEIVFPVALNIESLSACLPFKAKENLFLYGRSGTGKTHLATALGMNAINLGMNVIFRKTSRLINELKADRDLNRKSFWRQLEKADVLILDEWVTYLLNAQEHSIYLKQHPAAMSGKVSLLRLICPSMNGILYFMTRSLQQLFWIALCITAI